MRNSLPALQFCGLAGRGGGTAGGIEEEETVGANAQRQEMCAVTSHSRYTTGVPGELSLSIKQQHFCVAQFFIYVTRCFTDMLDRNHTHIHNT